MLDLSRLRSVASYAPRPIRRLAKSILFKPQALTPPPRSQGVIEDLYYWVADGRLDTILPLQNYFSVLFPDLETATEGTLYLNDHRGRTIGAKPFRLGAHALVKLRLSAVLGELGAAVPEGYGTLLCDLRIPEAVLRSLDPREGFYFWDRFYIGYLTPHGQPSFVHGVDKTYFVRAGSQAMDPVYPPGRRYTWVPELPIDLGLYRRLSVVVINRTTDRADVTLTMSDAQDVSRQWRAGIPPRGVQRFELGAGTAGESGGGEALRLRLDGMPTPWGRPVVFKEFPNGAISAMHC